MLADQVAATSHIKLVSQPARGKPPQASQALSSLLARTAAFLPQMQAANAALPARSTQQSAVEIEAVQDGQQDLVLPNGQALPQQPCIGNDTGSSGAASDGSSVRSACGATASSSESDTDSAACTPQAVQMDIACGLLDLPDAAAQAAAASAAGGAEGIACAQARQEDVDVHMPHARTPCVSGACAKDAGVMQGVRGSRLPGGVAEQAAVRDVEAGDGRHGGAGYERMLQEPQGRAARPASVVHQSPKEGGHAQDGPRLIQEL